MDFNSNLPSTEAYVVLGAHGYNFFDNIKMAESLAGALLSSSSGNILVWLEASDATPEVSNRFFEEININGSDPVMAYAKAIQSPGQNIDEVLDQLFIGNQYRVAQLEMIRDLKDQYGSRVLAATEDMPDQIRSGLKSLYSNGRILEAEQLLKQGLVQDAKEVLLLWAVANAIIDEERERRIADRTLDYIKAIPNITSAIILIGSAHRSLIGTAQDHGLTVEAFNSDFRDADEADPFLIRYGTYASLRLHAGDILRSLDYSGDLYDTEFMKVFTEKMRKAHDPEYINNAIVSIIMGS